MNRLKKRWTQGDAVVGVWSLIPEPIATEVVARAGFDFVLIDNQHSVHDYRSSVHALQAVALGDSVPLVRVPWNEAGLIGTMLDAAMFLCPQHVLIPEYEHIYIYKK